ncbi:MAG: ribosome biogenesis GTPase Der [Clostridiales bacterium]|nr:ribosome biogenesis GTPase Der [Clostridiales bacterium]
MKPIVAIVGRPNVGKSSFFNYVSGKKVSIVEDTPGVTRDRVYVDADWRGREFTMIDTGGIEPTAKDNILTQMREQAEFAIDSADVIVFMVDVKDGVTASDYEVAKMLRKTNKPIVLICNKVDKLGETPPEVYEFYNLDIGDPVPISTKQGLGIGDALDEIYNHFPEEKQGEEEESIVKVALIGKPNVGKSSLVNKILGEKRVIVSDIPGTTRDAIDTSFEKDGKKYTFIDTAGLRKKSKVNENIERYSGMRTLDAIERADVCLLLIDANEGVNEQDTKVAGYAHEAGKGVIIVVNKWDTYEKETGTLENYREQVYRDLAYLTYAPVIFISAKTGQRVDKLFELINYVADQNAMRISTGMLNDVVNEAIAMVQPPSDKGKRLKIYYLTQVSTKPPTFVIFVNNKKIMHFSYVRYLENQLRKNFGLEGTTLRFIIREKGENF